MGTKVQIDNYLAGHCSMRDLSRESNGASWPSCFGDNLPNGQFFYGFLPRTVAAAHPGYDKDVVKQTILEHEAVFKDQVYELHRLYRVQRDLMDEIRRKEQYERRIPYEASSSSSHVPSHMKSEDVQRWNGASLPLANSVCGRPTSGPEAVQSSPQSVKGKSIQASPVSFQNGYSPKNSDVSESRPMKHRRRMLDLQLPADEYIDTDEVLQIGDAKFSENVGPSHEQNGKVASENGNLFNSYAIKTECSSRLDSHVGKSMALADLNEPIDLEETTVDSSANFLNHVGCHDDVKHWAISTKSFVSSRDVAQNSMHGSGNGIMKNLENRPSSQDLFCYALEPEQQNGSMRFINEGVHLERGPKPFHSANAMLDPTTQPPAFLIGGHFKGDPWKAKSGGNIEKYDGNYSLPNYNIPEQTVASHFQSQSSFYNSADLGKPWDQCASSWGRPINGLTQKSTPIQTIPILSSGNLRRSPLHSSVQSNGFLGNKWNLNCSPVGNATFDSEPYPKNGFYQGSASAKEVSSHIPPVGFDSGGNFFNAPASHEMKPKKDVNLNVALPNDVLHKSEDPMAVLPWLRGKGAYSDKAETANNGPSSLPDPVLQGPSLASNSCEGNAIAYKKPDNGDCPGSRKILGVPIFESLPTPNRGNCKLIGTSAVEIRSGKEETGPSGRKVFDMNVPCEHSDSELEETGVKEVVGPVEKKMQTESGSIRNLFDLNSCITEEEIPCTTSLPDNSRGDTGIDLEAPVILEDDEAFLPGEGNLTKEPEKLPELPLCRATNDGEEAELAKSAAEAIIAISSVKPEEEVIHVLLEEADAEDTLEWFVNIACSSGKDSNNVGDNGDCLPKELDDFESLTLRLKGCTPEEYFPKPSIPEFPNMEESSTHVLATRTRKGPARRGRQRRDFQRDILPGLASLSRHEVTEDMQTFGGLMRATGYSWQCGPNRRSATRNGSGRGRRRAVAASPAPVQTVSAPIKQQLQQINSNNTEVGLEDRSLTGWGKTTRRPRRQRLPAGNLTPPVPLS